jgi:hypothetical protein
MIRTFDDTCRLVDKMSNGPEETLIVTYISIYYNANGYIYTFKYNSFNDFPNAAYKWFRSITGGDMGVTLFKKVQNFCKFPELGYDPSWSDLLKSTPRG